MPQTHVRTFVCLAIILAYYSLAFALNPSLDTGQYAHPAWKVGKSFSKGTVEAIAQAPDGYFRLASEFGLFPFDGVRSVPWYQRGREPPPSNLIWTLLVSRDGNLRSATHTGHHVSAANDRWPGSSRKGAEMGS